MYAMAVMWDEYNKELLVSKIVLTFRHGMILTKSEFSIYQNYKSFSTVLYLSMGSFHPPWQYGIRHSSTWHIVTPSAIRENSLHLSDIIVGRLCHHIFGVSKIFNPVSGIYVSMSFYWREISININPIIEFGKNFFANK